MAVDKIYRILDIYIHLCQGGCIFRDKAAEKYEVDPRSIQRDIADLRDFMRSTGSPSYIIYDKALGGYVINSPQKKYLSPNELFAVSQIILSSKSFRPEQTKKILSALIELCPNDEKALLEDVLREDVSAYGTTSGGNFLKNLWTLASSVKDKKTVEIVYDCGENQRIKRIIHPLFIKFSEFRFYIAAYTEPDDIFPERGASSDMLTYRIDKIEKLQILENYASLATAPPSSTVELRKELSFPGGGSLREIHFRARASLLESVMDHIPSARIISSENGIYTFSAKTYGSGAARWLKSRAGYAELLHEE